MAARALALTRGRCVVYLVVDLNEVAELFGEDAASVVDGQLATRNDHLDGLLQVSGCSLQKAHHQILRNIYHVWTKLSIRTVRAYLALYKSTTLYIY